MLLMIAIVSIITGFILLSWAANRLVAGAAAVARNLHIPPLLIGLTVVALGTSTPEIVVSITAAIKGSPDLAIGNALGSNIANIGLVLGVAALLSPMQVHSQVLRREFPILFLIMALTWLLLIDGYFSQLDGIILFCGLALLFIWLIRQGIVGRRKEPMVAEYQKELPPKMSTSHALSWLMVGLVCLPLGSEILVEGATTIARALGISELTIGVTIIAIGTSLPELATSVMGALKKEYDISIGNILGSNMFNLLAVLPFSGLIAPSALNQTILTRDLPIMFTISIILFAVAYGYRSPGHITRLEGCLLLLCYIAYITLVLW